MLIQLFLAFNLTAFLFLLMKTQYKFNTNCLADLPYLQIQKQGQSSSNKAVPDFLFYKI